MHSTTIRSSDGERAGSMPEMRRLWPLWRLQLLLTALILSPVGQSPNLHDGDQRRWLER